MISQMFLEKIQGFLASSRTVRTTCVALTFLFHILLLTYTYIFYILYTYIYLSYIYLFH